MRRKKSNHTNTSRLKPRNFLTNISYNGVKEEVSLDRSFVFDVHVLTTKNFNPFSLEQKIFNVENKETIQMFWEECNKQSFYRHICKPDNFMYLNGKNIIYPHVADIVWKHFEEDEGNFDKIEKKLSENKKIVQFVYSSTYPEVYSFIEKRNYFSKSENSPPHLVRYKKNL